MITYIKGFLVFSIYFSMELLHLSLEISISLNKNKLLYSCRAVKNQKIKRERKKERKKGRTGELEKRRKRKKERKKESWWPVSRCGQWFVSGVTASGGVTACERGKEAKMKERKRDNIPVGVLGWPLVAPFSIMRAGRWWLGHAQQSTISLFY